MQTQRDAVSVPQIRAEDLVADARDELGVEPVSQRDARTETCAEQRHGDRSRYLYDFCQSDGRAGARPEAVDMAPWVDCESARAGARDGDPCEGELRCGRNSESRRDIVLYCDETGVTRLIGGSGFTFVVP